MIAFEDACKKAIDRFAESRIFGLASALDTEGGWIFFGGAPGETRIGGKGAFVSKEDGSVKDFLLPNRENFKLLDSGVAVDIPEEFKG